MSRKRGAAHQLTEDNWDKEEGEDDSDEEVQEVVLVEKSDRKFKKAVRRGAKLAGQGGSTVNPFQGFGGFSGFGSSPPPKPSLPATTSSSSTSSTTPIGPSVDFWKNANKDGPFFNPSSAKTSDGTAKVSSGLSFSFSTKSTATTTTLKDSGVSKVTNGKHLNESPFSTGTTKSLAQTPTLSKETGKSKYTDEIIDLNLSVLAWIKKHIDENPCLDLSPVFRDYESYMAEIEKKFGSGGQNEDSKPSSEPQLSPVTNPAAKIGISSPTSERLKGPDPDSAAGISPKGTGFFSTLATSTPLPQTKGAEGTAEEADERDDEHPPKQERTTIVEEDALHTVRCKLFFKKGEGWQDLGVGMLYLKPMESGTQLLVRMETATGKILLNVCLTSSVPVCKTGKNNLTLVSLPNPAVFSKPAEGDNSKPVTYLIRVKGETEANKLFEKINERKTKEA